MPDFSTLLKKPAGQAKKPEALPAGSYPGVIKGYEYGDNNKNKTPYVRYALALTGWADGVEPLPDVDLSKRRMNRDYFLTDDALWRLDEFLRSVSLEPEGRSYEEVIPEAVGTRVLIEVQQYLNQKNNEIGNQVNGLVGEG